MKKSKKVAANKKTATKGNELFDFDDEIVIGITKKEDKPEEKNKKNKRSKKKQKTQQKEKEEKKEKKKKKRSKGFKIAKYIILFIIIIGAIVALLMSPIFKIKEIVVTGNSKITTEEIISLSGVMTDVNTFKIRLGQVENNIRQNPYIESVKVSRNLPSGVTIEVTERIATYMIEFVNSMVYINNQGYMLEVTEEKIPIPVISGINTPLEDFKPGNRLQKEDLQKLEVVLKIMDTLGSHELSGLVTGINIADKNNYILYMDGEGKIVYLGNASNINTRIMYLKEIIEKEKGIRSEIFINKDINKDDVYTREMI